MHLKICFCAQNEGDSLFYKTFAQLARIGSQGSPPRIGKRSGENQGMYDGQEGGGTGYNLLTRQQSYMVNILFNGFYYLPCKAWMTLILLSFILQYWVYACKAFWSQSAYYKERYKKIKLAFARVNTELRVQIARRSLSAWLQTSPVCSNLPTLVWRHGPTWLVLLRFSRRQLTCNESVGESVTFLPPYSTVI